MMIIKISPLNSKVILPSYKTTGSSGADVRACIDRSVVVEPYSCVLVPTGLSVEIPEGYEIQIRSRSGLSLNDGIIVLNSPGTIDSDYRGEIKIILFNCFDKSFTINNGDRIAQMVLCKTEKMEFKLASLGKTERSLSGFGSTGVK